MGAVWRRSQTSAPRAAARPAREGAAAKADLVVRPAVEEDTPAIVDLLCQTLGWQPDDRHRALFAWKHRDNPFGPSPSWVAVDGEGIAGVRIFMRWRFLLGDRTVQAVRAVDTATHPRARGLGIFRTLTMRGVDEMKAQGVSWVFNTPNDQSLPGYLSMGWQQLGHLPVALRPARLRVMPRLASARVPAELWSAPTSAGVDAASVLAEEVELSHLLASQPPTSGGVRTARSASYLQWRYGAGPVAYRAMLAGPSLRDGVVFFRVRRRGPATEVAIGDTVVPGGDPRLAGRLGRQVLKASGGDYVIALGSARPSGWVRLPRIGPLLTWRALADAEAPAIEKWELSAGDVELF
jgi:GNAT superfamily N-acetyltransferase